MLHERTCAIAKLAGRTAPYVTQDDYEQAKLELTGDPYAVIMDTTIDGEILSPTHSNRPGPISTSEVYLESTGPTRLGAPPPQLFWGRSRPLAGA